MATQYKLRVLDADGDFLAEFTNMRSFSYAKVVNEPGLLTFDVDDGHPVVALLDGELDFIVEAWRRDKEAGIAWYCDFRGLVRDELREANSDGNTMVRFFCPGPLSLLRRVIVAYRSTATSRAKFTATAVETIMNTLVRYNATSAGTTGDGRIRTVDLTQVAVETDGGFGTAIDYNAAMRPLLDVLQEITRMAPGDFDMVYLGGGQWEYRFYEQQLGTDRTASVTFALQWGNMANPVYARNRINERTVAIVGGAGDESARPYIVRIPVYSNYDAAVNSVEFYADGRGATSTDQLQAIGDAAIYEVRADERLNFEVLQIESLRYGRDYFLGDRVRGYYQGINKTLKIHGVTVAMDGSGAESISIEMRKD